MARFNLDNYVPVQERIVHFWKDYPDGRILTAMMSDPADFTVCRYRADVYRDAEDTRPAATGYAVETAGGGGANQTSHEENCETSAIGRALANLGYATTQQNRPSREEMAKVDRDTGEVQNSPQQRVQRPHPPQYAQAAANDRHIEAATEPQIKMIKSKAKEMGWQGDEVRAVMQKNFGKQSTLDLTKNEASTLIDILKAGIGTPA